MPVDGDDIVVSKFAQFASEIPFKKKTINDNISNKIQIFVSNNTHNYLH